MISVIALIVGAWLAGIGGQTMIDPVFAPGAEAVGHNPALLARPDGRPGSVDWFSLRLRAVSNHMTLDHYRRYFRRPTFLTGPDKRKILEDITTSTLEFETRADISAFQARYHRFGAGIDYRWSGARSLPRTLFELAFNGNEFNRTYDLGGFATDELAMLRVTMAGGLPLGKQMALGLSLAWLHGLNYVHTTLSSGQARTTPHAITGYLAETRTQADAGDGFAVSFGTTLQLGTCWNLGLTLSDLASVVWWHGDPGMHIISTDFDSLDAFRFIDRPVLDSFLFRRDSFSPTPVFATTMAPVAALGVGFAAPSGKMRLAAIMNLRLRSDRFTPEPPLGAVRLDLHPIPMLHLSLMPGWHRRVGPGGNAAVGFTVGRAMLALGAEAWGLPAVNDAIARFRVSTGY